VSKIEHNVSYQKRERPQIITISDAAIERIKHLLAKREKPAIGIRIGVKSGGCSGLAYKFEYAELQEAADEVVEAGEIRLFVAQNAVMYLIGTRLDYIDQKVKSGFVFINPNEKGTCGCGESFHV